MDKDTSKEIFRAAEKGKNTVQVVAALICDKQNGKILICQRPKDKKRGLLWEFPGGKVEPGESKEEALLRECREELGINLAVGGIYASLVHRYEDITIELTLFKAVIKSGKIKKLEHNDIRWIEPKEVCRFDFCPADREIVQRISEDEIV